MNLTAELGKILINGANSHLAPDAVADEAEALLRAHNVEEDLIRHLTDCVQELACFITID